MAKETRRPCYQPKGCFELTLHGLRRADNETGLDPSLLEAIKLFGLLDSLGGQSRRGWGSVALTELEGEVGSLQWKAPQNLDQYRDALSSILGSTADAAEDRSGVPHASIGTVGSRAAHKEAERM